MIEKIFISYCHKDVAFKNKLVEQLQILKLAGICRIWDDSQIKTGLSWEKEIETALNESLIAVLMVSQGFMESTFIMKTELPFIRKRKETDGLIVLPIFVNSCNWRQNEFIKEIQVISRKREHLFKTTRNPKQIQRPKQKLAHGTHEKHGKGKT